MSTEFPRATLRKEIVAAIDAATLRQILTEATPSRNFDALVTAKANYTMQVGELIELAIHEGWIPELVEEVLKARAGNQHFVKVVQPIADNIGSYDFSQVLIEPPPPPRRWPLLARVGLLPVALAAAIGIFVFWPRPPEPVWSDVTKPIELVLPTETYSALGSTTKGSTSFGPGVLEAGKEPVAHIRETTFDGSVWYEITLSKGEDRYLPKTSIPVWQKADPNLEILHPIKALAWPYDDAEVAAELLPGDLLKRQDYGALQEADIVNETWLRVPQRQGQNVFFSKERNQENLALWTPFDGCLKLVDTVFSLRSPVDKQELNPLYKGRAISQASNIQTAEIGGKQWFRFRSFPDAEFEYLAAQDVAQSPCGTD